MLAKQLRRKPDGEGIRVLLVEDNPGDVGLIEAALEDSDGQIEELRVERRLSTALSELNRGNYSVVLLDLNLPDSTGFDTVTAIQSAVPKVPIVVMTGNPDFEFARMAINAGVQDYLIKEYVRPTTLARTIYFAIDRKRIENDLHALERVATAASSSLDLDSIIRLVLNTLREEMVAQRTSLVLYTKGQRSINESVEGGGRTDEPDYRRVEQELIAQVMASGEPLFKKLTGADGAVSRTVLKVPMRVAGKIQGVVEVDWFYDREEYPREKYILEAAAERIAGGITNAKAFESVKASERAAEDERQRLRTIIDNLPVGILITDAHGKELESNSFRKMIWGGGVKPSRSIDDLSHLKGWWASTGEPVEECPVVKALKYRTTTLGAIIDIERNDRTRATILSSSAPIVDSRGSLIGAIGVQQDITKQVKMERELTEAKDRAEFYIDLLTHDIDNSLASVSGYLQLVDDSEQLSEKGTKWISGAFVALQESIDLISTVRKIQQSRTAEITHSMVDLHQILSEIIANAQEKYLGEADISYHPFDKPNVVGNNLLKDLFNNLLGNSVKHAAGPVMVEVNVQPATVQGREYIRVDVTDNGKGIPDELKDRLFKKGVRGSAKAPGRGLGLFLAHNIVLGTGGQIWVEDRVPGDHTQGARFVVLLPRADR